MQESLTGFMLGEESRPGQTNFLLKIVSHFRFILGIKLQRIIQQHCTTVNLWEILLIALLNSNFIFYKIIFLQLSNS